MSALRKNFDIACQICNLYNLPHQITTLTHEADERSDVLTIERDGKYCYLNSGNLGTFPTDTKLSSSIARSKQTTKQILGLHNFITPLSVDFSATPTTAPEKENIISSAIEQVRSIEIKYPLVLKPNFGNHGLGISFPKNEDELRTKLTELSSTTLGKKHWIIEEYLFGLEYRLFVVFGKLVFSYRKAGNSDYQTANITTGGVYSEFTTEIPTPLSDYCMRLYHCLGLSVFGIDLKTKQSSLLESTADDLTILEVNAGPGMGVVEKEKGIDFIYHNIMKPVLDKYFSSL